MSFLFGSGEVFDTAALSSALSARFVRNTSSDSPRRLDRAIDSGFILPADRSEILELAAATFGS